MEKRFEQDVIPLRWSWGAIHVCKSEIKNRGWFGWMHGSDGVSWLISWLWYKRLVWVSKACLRKCVCIALLVLLKIYDATNIYSYYGSLMIVNYYLACFFWKNDGGWRVNRGKMMRWLVTASSQLIDIYLSLQLDTYIYPFLYLEY